MYNMLCIKVIFRRPALKQKRILWLDYARCFAIICVVLIHGVERIYAYDAQQTAMLSAGSLLFRNIAFVAGRLGVPVFLAITGYLLLDREYSSADKIFRFYKHNLLPIIITTEIWNLIYDAVIFIGNGKFDFDMLIRDLLFFKTNQMGNMWYMPMIIGVYVALPFVANAIRNIETKALAVPFVLLGLSVFAFCFYSQLKSVFGWSFQASAVLDISFLGGTYGFYILFGVLCKRGSFKKVPSCVLWLVVAAASAAAIWFFTFSIRVGKPVRMWYDFIGVMLASCSVFELFSRMNESSAFAKKLAPLATGISVSSFGTFFVHKVVIYYLGNVADKVIASDPIKTSVFCVLVFVISAAVSYLFYKIPKFNRLIMAAK